MIKIKKGLFKNKYTFIAVLPILIFLLYQVNGVSTVHAVSGACSSHGGVDCSAGAGLGGSAVCNDGWTSSVSFSQVDECRASCTPPTALGCTSESDYGTLELKLVRYGGYLGESSSDAGVLLQCRQQITSYQSQLQSYNSCVSNSSSNSGSASTDLNSYMQTYMQNYCTTTYGSNSSYNSTNITCACNAGYKFGKAGQCIAVAAYCAESVGANSLFDTSTQSCSCTAGYIIGSDNKCIPLNAHAVSTTTWACNDGYMNNGIGCQLPPNGSLAGGKLTCNAGYINYNGSCQIAADLANNLCWTYTQYSKGDGSSLGSFSSDGTLNCNCPPNQNWHSNVNRCDATPAVPIATATPITPIAVQSQPTIPSTTTAFAPITQNLQVGASGQNVVNLQHFLEIKGVLTLPAETSEGYFGNLTKQALIAFQKSVSLPATGYCGPMTRQTINGS